MSFSHYGKYPTKHLMDLIQISNERKNLRRKHSKNYFFYDVPLMENPHRDFSIDD